MTTQNHQATGRGAETTFHRESENTNLDFENVESQSQNSDQLLVGRESDVDPLISVVMPTLNEEDGVGKCIERAKNAITELGVTAEIILSDSSTDRTPAIGREMGAIVVEPDAPGYGYAYRYAFERARGEYIVIGDADTTYDFEAIPELLDRMYRIADRVLVVLPERGQQLTQGLGEADSNNSSV